MLKIEMSSDIAQFINRLEKFDQDVSKELKKAMKQGSEKVVAEAKKLLPGDAPLSGWGVGWIERDREAGRDLQYRPAKARSSIKAAAFRARRSGVTVAFGYQAVQKDPAASIFETAGARYPLGVRSGTFNPSILRRFGSGPYPRIMYPAYYAGIREARDEIDAALQQARKRVGL
jgi:hypothetical protein